MNKSSQLRKLLERPGVIRLVGAHNALGAKLVERAGFEGVWAGGLGISASYALPDASIVSMSQYLEVARQMTEAVSIPIVSDFDTGYGNANNVIYMVKMFEAAGIAGVEALIAGWGQKEALKRARAYVDAGADAILIHSKKSTPDEVVEFIKHFKNCRPVVLVPTIYSMVTIKELKELKVKMVIYANQSLRAAVKAMEDVFEEIKLRN